MSASSSALSPSIFAAGAPEAETETEAEAEAADGVASGRAAWARSAAAGGDEREAIYSAYGLGTATSAGFGAMGAAVVREAAIGAGATGAGATGAGANDAGATGAGAEPGGGTARGGGRGNDVQHGAAGWTNSSRMCPRSVECCADAAMQTNVPAL